MFEVGHRQDHLILMIMFCLVLVSSFLDLDYYRTPLARTYSMTSRRMKAAVRPSIARLSWQIACSLIIPVETTTQPLGNGLENEAVPGRIIHHSPAFGRSVEAIANSITSFAVSQMRKDRFVFDGAISIPVKTYKKPRVGKCDPREGPSSSIRFHLPA